MAEHHQIYFGPFRLDPGNEQVWRGPQAITLKPKTFTVLQYLVAHAGRLVTKEELLDTLWPDVHVTDGVLKVCVRELRRALGDEAQAPQYIATVHRRGYRFIALLTSTAPPVSSSKFQVPSSQSALRIPQSAITLVGRESELRQLHGRLEKALHGERQIVFVTGEPGIGKTMLAEAFLAQVAADGRVWIGWGQCIEHYGTGEAYMPVLEALGRLCREPGGERLIALLNQHAPTWLVQMPALLSAAELEALQRKVMGATRERMLREMAETVEALTGERGLVLWLEDLQWSDVSTLDWLALVARRQEKARLLVIGTYRPVDVIVSEHPLKGVKQELQMHGHCEELPLAFLSEENVVDYLLARGVLVQSEGHWQLKERGEEAAGGVPESLQGLIAQQIEQLSPKTQHMLEVASVAGAEFSAAAVAAGVETEVEVIEEQCEELVRREQFLRASGTAEWPDRTVAARYGFLHALYQEVLYNRLTARRRQRLHQQIGEQLEQAYGEQAREIAAELAMHFERGREYRKAVQYLQHAAENATRRSAYIEAISLLTKGLELLKTLPDTPERVQQELLLETTLGPALMATKGPAAPEVGEAYTRARKLCQQVEETPQLFTVLTGQGRFYLMRAELQTAHELDMQCLRLAQRTQDPALLLEAHRALGVSLHNIGELVPAREHLEQGSALYDPQQHRSLALRYGNDPGAVCLSFIAIVLWLLGYPDQALQRSHAALTLARELAYPYSLAFNLGLAAQVHRFCREGQATQEIAERVIALSSEQGFVFTLARGTMLWGWALAEQGKGEEGIVQIRQGLAAYQAMGIETNRPYFLALLAEAYGKGGQADEGLSVLAEALVATDKTGGRVDEAELYRLKGELTLQQFKVTNSQSPIPNPQTEAEACFLKAIKIARHQQAKSLELRATVSLARLWQSQGRKDEARQMLAEIYGWFTEGFDTADLKEAKALLDELA